MFRKFTLLCLFLAFAVIVMGSYVRLSEAGLGCPDWPGCYGGSLVPDDAGAKRALPGVPFDASKAWKEMSHRYLAGALSLLIAGIFLISFWQKKHKAVAVGTSFVLLLLIVLQATLGMWTVTLRAIPVVVLSHLLTGLATLGVLYWLYLRLDPKAAATEEAVGPKGFAGLALLALVLQIALGGWTSTNYAALACPDFPTCHGSWWPDADYPAAFKVWRGLTGDTVAALLPPDALVAVHWAHRVGALVTFVVLGGLVLSATSGHYQRRVRKAGILLSVALLVQIGLGIAAVKRQLPLAVALGHSAFAPMLLMILVYLRFYSRRIVGEAAALQARDALREIPPAEMPSEAPLVPQQVVTPEAVEAEEVYVEKAPETLFHRLKSQLGRTRTGLGSVLAGISLRQKSIDEELLEEIEAGLLMADVGIDATEEIIGNLAGSLDRRELNDGAVLNAKLRENLLDILRPCNKMLEIPANVSPFVILVVGVNGVGKTTTIGKLAKRLKARGHSVMLAAGDTFRAAAVEQLQAWGERNQIQVIAQHQGADSASVIYDAVQAAKARGINVLIADTAGRLHTKSNLMEELRKIRRIIGRLDQKAPHEVLLVLDAGTGQNALSQAEQFNQAVPLTGIALTKLDGTAKGGVIFALAKKFEIPIRLIGVGEGIDDLQDFHAERFVDALFANGHGDSRLPKP